jgi:alkanesulfonate monooxygenase SsuD/methylene tetrahydromethanopterin reductase-like flavin-dependent oxidoreductase (luciferase family)
MTFHHPAILARKAASVDLLSHGRLILGVGAGWNQREHEMFGVPFYTVKERMDLLEQGIARMRDTWKISNPKPAQNPMPLLMGGRGEKRALPMIAREAAEWNLSHIDATEYQQKSQVLEECCRAIGRDPSTIRHSVMSTYIIGRDRADLRERAAKMRDFLPSLHGLDVDEAMTAIRKRGLVGTPDEMVEQIRSYAALGADLFMLQHFLLDDQDALRLLASDVMPAVA